MSKTLKVYFFFVQIFNSLLQIFLSLRMNLEIQRDFPCDAGVGTNRVYDYLYRLYKYIYIEINNFSYKKLYAQLDGY